MTLPPHERVFVPLDTPDFDRAKSIAADVEGHVGGVKVGKELFTALGPEAVLEITGGSIPLFLDLKFHDIPNTVAGAVRSAVNMRPYMLNVHAAGGRAMMRAAADAAGESADKKGIQRPLVLGVTVLTSLDDDDLKETGVSSSALDQVKRLAGLTQESGLDGVVCSGREIEALRELCGPEFKLVVPGIRPVWASTDDQKRVLTPADAVSRGADYLVIGRPITGASDPAEAASRIRDELAEAA